MGLREALKRADAAVQDTKQSVQAAAVLAVSALVVGVIALVVALTGRS